MALLARPVLPAPPAINAFRDVTRYLLSLVQTLSQYLFEVSTVVNGPLASYTVTTLPLATQAGHLIYVTNETGGATVAFSDGTNWRRVQDRAIVS